ncbi:MAG: manganese efflux pump [Lentisphaeria bacterium]|nr:manganese efflux pump [Lentisphaeria bacterium]
MQCWEILLLSLSVSIDAAAVSAAGMTCAGNFSRRHCAVNAALFFGGFQFLMPVAGYFAAAMVSQTVKSFDHWVAFALLTFVGGKMIYESWRPGDGETDKCPAKGFFAVSNMWLPAVATSLDALAVGAGLAFAGNTGIWIPAAAMGIITGLCSSGSVYLAQKIVKMCGSRHVGTAGGIAIVAIGVKILFEHLF